MKAETLLLVGLLGVGGYLAFNQMTASRGGAVVTPDDTTSNGTKGNQNQARDRAGKAFGVLGALFSSTSGVIQSWGET